MRLDVVVTLPRHSDLTSLSGLQLDRFKAFEDGVAAHEQTHVDIVIERFEAIQARLKDLHERFSDCASLTAGVSSIWDEERLLNDQQQEAFHEREAQISERLEQPVRQRIDDNLLNLGGYQSELALLSLEIEELEAGTAEVGWKKWTPKSE